VSKGTPRRRRALLSYIAWPLLAQSLLPRFMNSRSNKSSSIELVNGLNDCGYTVDVIDWQNRWWTPRRSYDLFVGHGGKNFERLSRHLDPSVPRIYYSTGSYWRYHTERANERIR
jgi:hypothetical protein